jgi:hypothetical protein
MVLLKYQTWKLKAGHQKVWHGTKCLSWGPARTPDNKPWEKKHSLSSASSLCCLWPSPNKTLGWKETLNNHRCRQPQWETPVRKKSS